MAQGEDHDHGEALDGCDEREHNGADEMRGDRCKQEGDREEGELNKIEDTSVGGGEKGSVSASFDANTVLAPNHDHYAVRKTLLLGCSNSWLPSPR